MRRFSLNAGVSLAHGKDSMNSRALALSPAGSPGGLYCLLKNNKAPRLGDGWSAVHTAVRHPASACRPWEAVGLTDCEDFLLRGERQPAGDTHACSGSGTCGPKEMRCRWIRQRSHHLFGAAEPQSISSPCNWEPATGSPRAFIFSSENAVCKGSYRRQCRE